MIAGVLIVDGYNIIHSAPETLNLKSLELSHIRRKLINYLSNYAGYKKYKVILVFDGKNSDQENVTESEGITVIFSKVGQTADAVIEKLVAEYINENYQVYVATSDFAQQRIVFGKGALRIPAREFWEDLISTYQEIADFNQKLDEPYRGQIGWRLKEDIYHKLESWRRKK